ncbi:hypothetical protein CMT52_20935, partial [Elizabethkingia anophelis]|nr:hypothetical protein [Elizabethkingia anophelis]
MSTPDRHKNKKSLRATNIELQSRDISVSNNDAKIYTRDYDNLYNLRIEKVINNSPTGKRCANMMAKFIIGNGIDESLDKVVNSKGETLNDIADLASNEISYQYGVFFFISWTIDVDYDNLKPKFV